MRVAVHHIVISSRRKTSYRHTHLLARATNTFKVTIIRIELKIGTNVGNTIIKKCKKSPSIPHLQKKLFKVKDRKNWFFAFFSQTVSFIIKIDQTKIVDHAILYKKCSYIFFVSITISEI
jgi:hypothetical protein